jgi:hypothetical protein
MTVRIPTCSGLLEVEAVSYSFVCFRCCWSTYTFVFLIVVSHTQILLLLGGTFGVVTNVLYKLHPLTPIVSTYWFVGGVEQAPLESIGATLSEWLKFWIEVSPDLDDRFGGYFNAAGVHLAFAGTREEANEAF